MAIVAGKPRTVSKGDWWDALLLERESSTMSYFGVSRTSRGSSTGDSNSGDVIEVMGEDVDLTERVGVDVEYDMLAVEMESSRKTRPYNAA